MAIPTLAKNQRRLGNAKNLAIPEILRLILHDYLVLDVEKN